MKNIILFCAGFWGDIAYYKLRKDRNIIFFVDNDVKKVGKRQHDIEIINVEKLKQIYDDQFMDVIICSQYFDEIAKQLYGIGIEKYYVILDGFLIPNARIESTDNDTVDNEPYFMDSHDKTSILFVQNTACIRTHKIANALKKCGWKICLAYSVASPEQSNGEYEKIYDGIYAIHTINQFIEFVERSNFDYIHCSNEPDLLTLISTQTKKVIIHDCHDLSSSYRSMSPEEMFIEFAANKNSNGVIYTTEGIRKEALKKFNLPVEKTFVLENLISTELVPSKRYEKISSSDYELHCVYEGGVVPYDRESHRYFEEIWTRLAIEGVHVHFYTNCERGDCSYLESLHERIHYEGNFSSKRLAEEMTKYDVGLCVLNVTEKNRQYLEYASPNKIQEYVNAGIPVAVGSITSQKEFVESNGFGREIDLGGNIFQQLVEISKIKIEDNILHKRGLTLESKIPHLINFYNTCKNRSFIDKGKL